ncbi:hypothetical protein HYT74_02845 [Candidatus Daviesbacteria bacterium]|nr:hypothetical protein [Candidatus Daviesbacteria bacterium]
MKQFTIDNSQLTIKILAFFFVLSIVHFQFSISIYAQEDNIGESQVNPASPLYFLKSVREVLELKFAATTNTKAFRQLEFATRRIREVKSLAKTPRQDLIEPTLYRYLSNMQELNGLVNLKDNDSATQVIDVVGLHMTILQAVYDQVSDLRARMSIRVTVNRLSEWDQQLIDRLDLVKQHSLVDKVTALKLSRCSFLAKEASSSALNEVEKVVLSERAQKCLISKQK